MAVKFKRRMQQGGQQRGDAAERERQRIAAKHSGGERKDSLTRYNGYDESRPFLVRSIDYAPYHTQCCIIHESRRLVISPESCKNQPRTLEYSASFFGTWELPCIKGGYDGLGGKSERN